MTISVDGVLDAKEGAAPDVDEKKEDGENSFAMRRSGAEDNGEGQGDAL